MSKCALCREDRNLVDSHIIPKFIIKWVKHTSATGYLRTIVRPNVRVQDSNKKELLCTDCEQYLSKLERYFDSNIFLPFQKKRDQRFKYDKRLQLFAISLSWRVMCSEGEAPKKMSTALAKRWRRTKELWRRQLTQGSFGSDTHEHHLFFFDFIADDSSTDIPKKFQWYTMRTMDATTAFTNDMCFIYTKLPAMIFLSTVEPRKVEGFRGTRISIKGVIGPPQRIEMNGFFEFLIERTKMTTNLPYSEKQKEKIDASLKGKRECILQSASFQVWFREQQRKK